MGLRVQKEVLDGIIQEVDEDGEGVGKKEFKRAMMFSKQREENMDRNQSQPCVGNVFSTSRHARPLQSLPPPFRNSFLGNANRGRRGKRKGAAGEQSALGHESLTWPLFYCMVKFA